jgi:uncharacterized protein YndB with AHSA1/START domain
MGSEPSASEENEEAMASIRVHARIAASADDVWKVIADFGNIADWFPPVTKSEQTGDALRVVELGPETVLEEKIVTLDGDLRRLQYAITSGLPEGTQHLATIDVLDDAGGALVVYSTDVTPDELGDMIRGALQAGVDGLKSYVEARS